MNKILLLLLIYIISWQNVMAQPTIVNCPLDTNLYFQITLNFRQYYDSTGKIKIQLDYGTAIPFFNTPEEFKEESTNEDCTPFNLEFIDDVIYIFDSTGNWAWHSKNSNKFILNKVKIIYLKIEMNNMTTKTFDFNDIAIILKKLNLMNIQDLEIIGQWDVPKSNIKLSVKHWPYKNIGVLIIYAPFIEKKTRLLGQLGKFKHLYKIEIHHPLVYY